MAQFPSGGCALFIKTKKYIPPQTDCRYLSIFTLDEEPDDVKMPLPECATVLIMKTK